MFRTLLALLFAVTLLAEDAPRPLSDSRHHYQILGDGQAVLYDVTEISRTSQAVSENYILVRDEGHGDFVLRTTWTFKDQTSTYRISDIKDRAFVQVTAKMPGAATTLSEAMAEVRANPSLTDLPSMLKVETNGGRWDGIEKDWDEQGRLRAFRHQLRQTTDFHLLEGIERMRGTIFTTDTASIFHSVVARYLIYDVANDDAAAKVKIRSSAPDCAFDEAFGFPCSKAQIERAEKAAKEGKELIRY